MTQSLSVERKDGHVLGSSRFFLPYPIIFPLLTLTLPLWVLRASIYFAVIVSGVHLF